MRHPRPILFLKANFRHDALGRFARAPAGGRDGAPVPPSPADAPMPVVLVDQSAITGASSEELRAAAIAYARNNFRSSVDANGRPVPLAVRNERGAGTIMLAPAGVSHGVGRNSTPPVPAERSGHHYQVVSALPELLRLATPHGEAQRDRKNRNGIVAVHHMRAAAVIDGTVYRVRLVVREHHDGRRYYEHDLSDIEKIGIVPDAPPPAEGEGHRNYSSGGASGLLVDLAFLKSVFNHEDGNTLAKAQAIPPGARWITVRPNGPGTEGRPLLIQPNADGSSRVIGGAGGKLNYLKLKGVRSEGEYAARTKEHATARRDQQREQTKRDAELGIAGDKRRARDHLRVAGQAARAEFVQQVSAALGWKPEDTRFREEDFQDRPASEVEKAQTDHFNATYDAAQKAVEAQRQRILADADMRADAGLSAIPLSAPDDPEQISVADLDPVSGDTGRGLGFLPNYEKRAAERGGDPAEMKAEADAVTGKAPPPAPAEETKQDELPGTEAPANPEPAPAPDAPIPETGITPASDGTKEEPPEAAAAADPVAEKGKAIADALEVVRVPVGPRVDPRARASAKDAMAVLRADKALREKLKQVRARAKEIDKAATKEAVEPRAFVMEVAGEAVDAKVMADVENDLRTIRTRGFLNEADKQGVMGAGKHLAIGAFNSVNSLALAAGGAALMDRSVVDVLGPEAAAQALTHRLAMDLTAEEMGQTKAAMERYHVDHYMERSNEALTEARELQEQAAEIQLGEASNGHDIALAQELNHRRRELLGRSKAILAQALGEMETNAAVVAAMDKPKRDRITVAMGDMPAADAIVRLRAIGLDRGDYSIERAGRNTILAIHGDAIGKLTAPINREDIARVSAAIAIMQGAKDEDGWLPGGVAKRPDFGLDLPMGVAPRLARPFPDRPNDISQAVRDYIGGRAADGDAAADILSGLLAEDVIQKSGDRASFMAAIAEVAPLYDAKGGLIRAEAHAETFDKLADEFTDRQFGATRAPINRQAIVEDATTADALHRALASHPEGAAAFKPVGDLSPQDQAGMRELFKKEFARNDPAAAEKRAALDKLEAAEPEKETDGLFGREANPDHAAWRGERDAAAEAHKAAEMTWPRYVETMGSPEAAYKAMQDVVKGKVTAAVASEHNRLRPDKPLRTGRTIITGDLHHLDALDPAARERRLAQHRDLVDGLRARVGGRYADGSVTDKIAAAREAEEAANQAQMGLFGEEPAKGADPDAPLPEDNTPLGKGERVTIGHAAERALGGLAQTIGRAFKAGQPLKLFRADFDGKFVARQRAVKLLEHNKRLLLGMGVGSGKTAIMLSSFTHLHGQGKVKKGIFLVPSIVQGEFHAEALKMLEPGKFNWHANPGSTREQRIAAMKDPDAHFSVMTHQSFRDDMLHLAGQQHGMAPEAMADRLDAMKPAERKSFMADVMAKEGINADYLAIDEGHNILNRRGKDNSRLANVVDAVAENASHYVSATADPIKNDASEIFDTLAKMDSARYSDRDAFMRKYGVDTDSARDGLRRELARHYYTASIRPETAAHKKEISVPLHAEDQARMDAIGEAAGAARLARMEGRVDIGAMRILSPGSFEGVPAEQHEDLARRLQDSVGIIKDSAVRRALNGRGKLDAVSKAAGERRGKSGVVFARQLDNVQDIAARLTAEGHKVITLTGMDSAKEKDRKKRAFQASSDTICVASDAACVGANLQKGKWLGQVDTPLTAMVHAQRNGRIDRIGQTEDVELLDFVADHPTERANRDRLARKYGLRDIVTSPLDGLDDSGLAGMLHRIRIGKKEAEPQPDAAPTEEERARANQPTEAKKSRQPELV